MSHNPTEVESPLVALPDHRVLAITGPDALKFAQAQFMNDVGALADGGWQWNGWLNAKGRLIALFALLRLDAETLWLALPDHPPEPLAEALKKYVFRSKLKLEVYRDLPVAGLLLADATEQTRDFDGDAEGGVVRGWPGGRRLVIGARAATADADADAQTRWREADLRAGLPRLDAGQSAQWTPQQLSLDRLQAYSVKKGCYPGQEIVARTHFLGQAKRAAVLLETATPAASGDEVIADGRAIGQIVSVAGSVALAVLPLERGDAQLQVRGMAASVV